MTTSNITALAEEVPIQHLYVYANGVLVLVDEVSVHAVEYWTARAAKAAKTGVKITWEIK